METTELQDIIEGIEKAIKGCSHFGALIIQEKLRALRDALQAFSEQELEQVHDIIHYTETECVEGCA